MKALERSQLLSHCMSMGIFPDDQGQLTLHSPKFNLIQAFIDVLINYKNEEDPIKNECARMVTTFLRCSGVANPVVMDGIWQAFMIVIVTCKMMRIHPKMNVL